MKKVHSSVLGEKYIDPKAAFEEELARTLNESHECLRCDTVWELKTEDIKFSTGIYAAYHAPQWVCLTCGYRNTLDFSVPAREYAAEHMKPPSVWKRLFG